MKIGIDITLLGAIYTGQHFYINSLLEMMIKMRSEDEFFLFSYGNLGASPFEHFDNVKIIPVVMGKYSKIKRIMAQFSKIPIQVKKISPDVFFSPAFSMPSQLKGVRTVVTVHDLIYKVAPSTFSAIKNTYIDFLLKRSLKNADKIIAISENTKRDIVKYFNVREDKISVIYYGVDEIFRNPHKDEKECTRLNLPEKYFVYVGTLEPRKNIPYIVRNFDRFSAEYPDYKLLLYGWEGELPGEVFRSINECKRKEKIEFRGYLDHFDLPIVYYHSQGLLFPSLYEGFGLPPVEAMATGCPVFVSELSSIPEVVGDAGIYIDVNKPYSLYDQMMKYEKEDLMERFRKSGIQRAAKFSWKTAWEETYKVFGGTDGAA